MISDSEHPPTGAKPVHPDWYASAFNQWSNIGNERMPASVLVWKNDALKLRVVGHRDGRYFVAPHEPAAYLNSYIASRIGPYSTLEDAELAAEMIGELT